MAPSQTDQACICFLTIDVFFLFLFMIYASSFPMNKSFPACTRGLLTSATCHVLLRINPSGVLTDMSCCPSFLMFSPPSPLNPFPLLDLSVYLISISGNMHLGIIFSASPESTTTVTFFHGHRVPAALRENK